MTGAYMLSGLDDFTIVRLPDGRVGFKGRWTRRGKAMVQLADGTGVELDKTVRVDVVRFPAQLAADFISTQTRAEGGD